MILDTKKENNLLPLATEDDELSPRKTIIGITSEFSSKPPLDDTRDASSATATSVDSYSQEDSRMCQDHHPKSDSRTMDRDIDVCERLYNETKPKQIEGKQRRLAIERILAKRRELPEILLTDTKIPLSQAENFYRKSVEWAMEKEEKLAAVASERGTTYAYQYNFKGNNVSWTGEDDSAKIPLSQAENFYRKSVEWAMEKEEKLAAVASERGTTYAYQYNFKGNNVSWIGEDSATLPL